MTEISNNFMKGLHVTTEWPTVDALVAGYMRAASIRALQKIRQEIEDEADDLYYAEVPFEMVNTVNTQYDMLKEVIEIIDKHIKEYTE